ncbi:ecto-NOX disulfide-thiol exchanger 2-like [Uloborus diversus]|uniref:ecto-NOX disulfide-thiol exchanger 2-like n=1 Tax=Uloborus diversus TaxID=327109 RepID=UPI00240A426D|nr:ecto-NOX disulfide-thiol exchanger 2-like [Uloborus diversus]XP_054711532.1 ecto-NOX disulfide-thiol exchanger 2-like [Uloborus diversus]
MEGNNNGTDSKESLCGSYPGNTLPRESSTSDSTCSQWNDGQREQRNGKKFDRDRSRHRKFNRSRPYHGKNLDNPHDDSVETSSREEPQQVQQPLQQETSQSLPASQQPTSTPVYPAYGYNQGDHTYLDGNRRALSMMPAYNYYPAPWGMNPMDMSLNSVAAALPVTSGIEMGPSTSSGMNPYAYMGMSGDGSMYGMMGMGNYCQYGIGGAETGIIFPPKEIITLTKSVMYPPEPKDKPPTIRDRPLGCRTIFVGGLPEKTTEEIIREIFERCGEISVIRMSKKNFCHIRFTEECHVDNAIYLSGYKLKIENKDDAAYCNRVHVDFSNARDDQYEYECRQRKAQREARHKEQMVPTPPPVVQYSDHEATILGEKLRGEDTFQEAVSILITWLERGECSKRNAGYFYSMIQSTNSHIRRLMNEKLKYEDELNKAKIMSKQQMQGILLQFNEIGKVFSAASLQKVWDHFTKAQRKNIEMWKKQTEKIKNAHLEEVLNDRIEDEMDVSDDDSPNQLPGKGKSDELELQEELSKLKEECDSLKCQLEASQNELMVVRSEIDQKRDNADHQVQSLKQALQGLQHEILSLNQKRVKDEAELKELRSLKSLLREEGKEDSKVEHDRDTEQRDSFNFVASSVTLSITEHEARLIGLISTFLNVHPFGASIDYICSYLHQIDCTVRARDVESLMKRFPLVFKEESTGIGASLEKKWTFSGFK